MGPMSSAPTWFTFLDRSLKYDCARCGSMCCKGTGVALDGSEELVRFARLEPRLASLLRVGRDGLAAPLETKDGCWMLRPDGLCAIETDRSREEKPSVCLLFPFNRIFQIGGVRVVDVNSRLCPIEDAWSARDGQSWEGLLRDLDAAPAALMASTAHPAPLGAPAGFLALESHVRDNAPAFLEARDYVGYAAFQEHSVQVAFQGRTPRPPGDPGQEAVEEELRALLGAWRRFHGVEADPGLAAAASRAARQVALLTSSFRLNLLLRDDAAPWSSTVQLLPRQLLAAAHLTELAWLGRRRPPGLRAASDLALGAQGHLLLLALFTRKARLRRPPPLRGPPEVQELVSAICAALEGAPTLGAAADRALAGAPPHLRSLAFAQLDHREAEIEFE